MSDVGRTLVFELHGLFSAYGSPSTRALRTVDRAPTKSGVVGLVANCLGLGRTDVSTLCDELGIVVRTVAAGRSFMDYHTVQGTDLVGGAAPRTRRDIFFGVADRERKADITLREWVVGAYHVVGIWTRPSSGRTLEEIRDALIRPARVPYLGRKAASMTLPMRPEIVPAEPVAAVAARDVSNGVLASGVEVEGRMEILCDVDCPDAPSSGSLRRRRDAVLPASSRSFGIREERFFVHRPGEGA